MKRRFLPVLVCFLLTCSFAPASGAPPDTAVIAQGIDATTLDPHLRWDTAAINVLMNIYDFLLTRSPDTKIEPLLAQSYKLVNDTTSELTAAAFRRTGTVFEDAALGDAVFDGVTTHTDLLRVYNNLQSASLDNHLLAFQTCN